MGGPWQVSHLPHKDYSAKQIADITYNALFEIEQQMSHFLDTSYLMQLNATPVGEWLEVPYQAVEVFSKAEEISKYTNGALNIGLGKEIVSWGFGNKDVENQEIINKYENIQHSKVVKITENNDDENLGFAIDSINKKIKRTKDLHFNLASIAKGYAVDYATKKLEEKGIDNFIIEVAGEIKCRGQKGNNADWTVGLELPIPGQFLVYDHISLDNDALATSGSYRKYKELAGKHLSHTFNPRTKTPINSKHDDNLLAVCVRDKSCMYADAMATALFVMCGAVGSEFADKNNIPALFLLKDELGICEIRSRAWVGLL